MNNSEPISVDGALSINGNHISACLKLTYHENLGLQIVDANSAPAEGIVGGRKTLTLAALGRAMIYRNPTDSPPYDYNYSVMGANLGTFTDVFSCSQDFDGDTRIVTSFDLTLSYSKKGIQFELNGRAVDRGEVAGSRPLSSPSGDWMFTGSFLVPSQKLHLLFGIHPETARIMLNGLANLP